MRMCDRHNRTKATDTMHIKSLECHFDLCRECSEQVVEFMANTKQETVEKPKRNILGLRKNSA